MTSPWETDAELPLAMTSPWETDAELPLDMTSPWEAPGKHSSWSRNAADSPWEPNFFLTLVSTKSLICMIRVATCQYVKLLAILTGNTLSPCGEEKCELAVKALNNLSIDNAAAQSKDLEVSINMSVLLHVFGVWGFFWFFWWPKREIYVQGCQRTLYFLFFSFCLAMLSRGLPPLCLWKAQRLVAPVTYPAPELSDHHCGSDTLLHRLDEGFLPRQLGTSKGPELLLR